MPYGRDNGEKIRRSWFLLDGMNEPQFSIDDEQNCASAQGCRSWLALGKWLPGRTSSCRAVRKISGMDDSRCCGCGACLQICPHDAIAMETNTEGFAYPRIRVDRCVSCGLCTKVCPRLHPDASERRPVRLFAARARDAELRRESSSGGLFSVLAQEVFARKGVVFGAAWDLEAGKVVHRAAHDSAGLKALRGSKYVQSETGRTFCDVRAALQAGQLVLYSGTPCQNAALRLFLGAPEANLVCVDVVCHGVPSPGVFGRYLDETHSRPVRDLAFRDKSGGWRAFSLRVNGAARGTLKGNIYLRGFLSNLFLRPSCHTCPSADKLRSDFTFADFWNIRDVVPAWNDDTGASAVLVATPRGQELFDACRDRLEVQATDSPKFVVSNRNVLLASPRHPRRNRFMKTFARGDVSLEEAIRANLAWTQLGVFAWKIKRHFSKKKMKRLSGEILERAR